MLKKIIALLFILGVGVGIYFSSRSTVYVESNQQDEVATNDYVDFEYYSPTESKNTLVVLLHGGSWEVGDKWQLAPVGKYLAGQGLSVVNANYRLTPKWQFDAPLQDIAAVIKTVEADKAFYELKGDYRLVILGFSAGGHLATQFCVSEDRYEIKQVDKCIGLAGVYDLARIVANQDGPLLVDAVKAFLGDTPPIQASPTYVVAAGEPTKFLLIRGENDTVVSPEQMKGLSAKLIEKGVMVEEMVVPQRDHLSIFAAIPFGDNVAQKIMSFIER